VLLLQLPLLHLHPVPDLLLQVLGLQRHQESHLLLVLRAAAGDHLCLGCRLLYCLAAGSWTARLHLLCLLLSLLVWLPDWGHHQCCWRYLQVAAVVLVLQPQMALQRCRQPGRCLRHKVQRVNLPNFQ
jgi:hypothetical protein